jgi:hypothetical protein
MEADALSSSVLRRTPDEWLQSASRGQLLTDRDVVGTKLHEVPVRLRRGSLTISLPVRSEPTWFYPTLGALQDIAQLLDNWDSYGSAPIEDAVIVEAMRVLIALELPPSAPPPSVVPGSLGDIQLEWHLVAGDVEILVSNAPPVSVHLFSRASGEQFESGDLSDDVVRLVNSLLRTAGP